MTPSLVLGPGAAPSSPAAPNSRALGILIWFPLRFLSRLVSLKCSVLAGKCAASWFLSLFFFKSLSQRTVSPRVVAPCASSSYGPSSLGWVFCMDVHPLIVQAFASLHRRTGKGRP